VPEPEAPVEAPAPEVVERVVQISEIAGSAGSIGTERMLRVHAVWRLRPLAEPRAGDASPWIPVAGLLCGPELAEVEARAGGEPLILSADAEGRWFAVDLGAETRLELRGSLPLDDRGEAVLTLLDAPRGELRVPPAVLPASTEATGPLSPGAEPGLWLGSPLRIHLAPRLPSPEPPPFAVGTLGLGITVTDVDARVRGRVVLSMRRGTAGSLRMQLPPDFTVEGPELLALERSGLGDLLVRFRGPVTEAVLELRGALPLPETRLGQGEEGALLKVPEIQILDVDRSERFAALAREGSVDVAPRAPGWTPRPRTALPDWLPALVDGSPLAFLDDGAERDPLVAAAFRTTPAESPAVLAVLAEFTAATAEDGAVLLRARWDLENDRAPALRVSLPEASRVVMATVDGRWAAQTMEEDGSVLRIALPRSLRSVEGLASTAVELVLLYRVEPPRAGPRSGRLQPWNLPLPSVDAPVAVSRASIVLPPGWRDHGKSGEGGRVLAFAAGADRGWTYDLEGKDAGLADSSTALPRGPADGDDRHVREGEQLWRQAQDAWLRSDAKRAKEYVDAIEERGLSHSNVSKLKANLEALGIGGEVRDDAAARNLKSEMQARAQAHADTVEELSLEADKAAAAGDWAAAEAQYAEAEALGEDLALLAQVEDREASERQRSLSARAAAARNRAEAARDSGRGARWGGAALLGSATPRSIGISGYGSGGAGSAYGMGSGHYSLVVSTPLSASAPYIPIPRAGDAVRFEQVLLPPGAAPAIALELRPTQRIRSRTVQS
jgi:hypothetical protein